MNTKILFFPPGRGRSAYCGRSDASQRWRVCIANCVGSVLLLWVDLSVNNLNVAFETSVSGQKGLFSPLLRNVGFISNVLQLRRMLTLHSIHVTRSVCYWFSVREPSFNTKQSIRGLEWLKKTERPKFDVSLITRRANVSTAKQAWGLLFLSLEKCNHF